MKKLSGAKDSNSEEEEEEEGGGEEGEEQMDTDNVSEDGQSQSGQ